MLKACCATPPKRAHSHGTDVGFIFFQLQWIGSAGERARVDFGLDGHGLEWDGFGGVYEGEYDRGGGEANKI